MSEGSKERLERYVTQTENALERAEGNIQKMLDMYEGRAPKQYDDCMLFLALLVELRTSVEEFHKSRM